MKTVNGAIARVALYYREGKSDKVYQVAIEPAGSQFVVNFAYGRRGATLTTGTKTTSPVDYPVAQKIYAKLVGDKQAKGYHEGEYAPSYQHAEKQASGILPQLLNPIEAAEVELLLCNDSYCAQEKFDGKHLLVRKQDDGLTGINKKGFVVGLSQTVAKELGQVPGSFIPDGEAIGQDYHLFDLLEHNGENLRGLPYRIRLARLLDLLLLGRMDSKYVRLVTTAFSTRQKTELYHRLRQENREGIVFKRLDAPYVPGKPSCGGSQLKFKFVATVSAIVAKVNTQRSVEVSLLQGRSFVSCGNVTIPANQEIPPAGAIVEVRYLYAYRDSLALYQPVYLGVRTDVATDECTVAQLKFKAE